MKNTLGKVLRIIAIVMMALTAAFNILGGAGTSCAAFLTKQFPPMFALYDYRWLYQILVVTTLAIGVAGIVLTVGLSRGGKHAFRNALIILLVGTAFAAIHYFASLALRGKAAPANIKFYLNALTLLIFLIYLIPGIRQKVHFEKPGGSGRKSGAGLAAIMAGMLVLSTPMWAASSHTYQGENWVFVLGTPILIVGISLVIGGILLLASSLFKDTKTYLRGIQVEATES